MCDRVDGCPEDMRGFQQLGRERPDLSTVPTVTPGGPCGAGMLSCADLSTVDCEITPRLLHFLTAMAQGVDGYVEILGDAAQTYEDGASASAGQIALACVSRLDAELPDVAPELSTARPGPQDA